MNLNLSWKRVFVALAALSFSFLIKVVYDAIINGDSVSSNESQEEEEEEDDDDDDVKTVVLHSNDDIINSYDKYVCPMVNASKSWKCVVKSGEMSEGHHHDRHGGGKEKKIMKLIGIVNGNCIKLTGEGKLKLNDDGDGITKMQVEDREYVDEYLNSLIELIKTLVEESKVDSRPLKNLLERKSSYLVYCCPSCRTSVLELAN